MATGMKNELESGPDGIRASRRTVLALGAVAASSIVTIKPALAQTTASVLNCQIPVPAVQKLLGRNDNVAGFYVPRASGSVALIVVSSVAEFTRRSPFCFSSASVSDSVVPAMQ